MYERITKKVKTMLKKNKKLESATAYPLEINNLELTYLLQHTFKTYN